MNSRAMSSEGTVTPVERLILHSPNPLDLSVDDLRGLAAQLSDVIARGDYRDLSVAVDSYDPLGAGNHIIDMLYVILPRAEFMKDTIFATVVASVTSFMRERFKRKHESKRPRKVYFFAPDSRLLGVLMIEDESTEARWLDEGDNE